MNDEDLSAKLYALLSERFELDPDKVTPEARLHEDLELDSIDAVDLSLAIEDLTGCETTPNEFQNAETVADVEKIVRKLINAQ